MKKILLTALFCIAVVLLISCSDARTVIMENAATSYKIVRSDIAADYEVKAAVELKKAIAEITGVELELGTDFESERTGEVRGDFEILVGSTNRDEDLGELAYSDYCWKIPEGSTRVVIDGGSEAALSRAVEAFIAECVSETGITVPKSGFEYKAEYPMKDKTLGGIKYSEIKTIVSSSALTAEAAEIAVRLGELCGHMPEIAYMDSADGYSIKLGCDADDARLDGLDSDEALFLCDGESILVATDGSFFPHSRACELFLEKIIGNEKYSTSLNERLSAVDESLVFIKDVAAYNSLAERSDLKLEVEVGKSCTGVAYYISENGDDTADGSSPDKAWKSPKRLSSAELKSGDGVYFECGGVYRGSFKAVPGVEYKAYGSGEKPVLISIEFKESGEKMKSDYQTLVSDQGVTYNFLTIDDADTYRGYFGNFTWLADDSGFICGKPDGSFFFYDVKARELVYLDKTYKPSASLGVYVNPVNSLAYYKKKNEEGFEQLWSIDPKTCDKQLVYTSDREKLSIGLEVTNDGRYTYYVMGYPIMADNEKIEFGRIDLEKGVIDRTREYGFSMSNCINHFVLNPEYPELLLFHHEGVHGLRPKDRLNIMDLSTGEVITYAQPGEIAAHAMWTRDGENVTFTDYHGGTALSMTDKKFENRKTWLVESKYGGANHGMMDSAHKYALTDDFMGVAFVNLETGEKRSITLVLNRVTEGHPFHAHAEISASGRICSWGMANADGVLGIAWIENPELAQK